MKVIDGAEVWSLSATHGLPLEFIIPELGSRDMVPAWDRLLEAAQRDGADLGRLGRRLHDMIGDSYPEHKDIMREKLGTLLKGFGEET